MTDIDFSRMRVLVVEGDRAARDRIVAILEGVGIRQRVCPMVCVSVPRALRFAASAR